MPLRLLSLLIFPFLLLGAASPAKAPHIEQYFTPAGRPPSVIRAAAQKAIDSQIPKSQEPLRGIYLTSSSIMSEAGKKTARNLAELKGNLIVVDVQSGGRLAYPSQLPTSLEIGNSGAVIPDLANLVAQLHDQGFYVAARYVLFKNGFLAKARPFWTLKNRSGTAPFSNGEGAIWLDPTNPDLAQYLTQISLEIADAGFDEIQFDYVRFPEAGKGGAIYYSFVGDKVMTRDQAITQFVAAISKKIHEAGVNVGLDIFGIVVWDNVSWKLIGQKISDLAEHVDVLYPMPYPSHFGPGWGGHKNPADEPYFFVQETTKKFMEQTAHTSVKIRPWLQGFVMRVSRFGPQYIKDQIRALTDIGIQEFAVWNAGNSYEVTFKALAEL